jgi:hypothetical protein
VRFVVALIVALALAGAARAGDVQVLTLPASEDLSLPFWCDWGYDWDERCYWDDSDRLGVGGVDDKVWRAGLRFSLDALPPGARVVTAELSLWYDQTCVAPRRTTVPCDGRGFELDAHPIFTPRWRSEREVEFGPVVASAVLDPQAPSGRLVWDMTDTVAAWWSGDLANDGLLLKLSDNEEAFDSSGPVFPSSSHPDPALRPQLAVWYLVDSG